MTIKKIKLVVGGLKGAEISYVEPNPNENKTFLDDKEWDKSDPIHLGLESRFKALRIHLLRFCELVFDDTNEVRKQALIEDTEVRAIKIEGQSYTILGARTVGEDKVYKLDTPVIDEEDNYPYFDDLVKLVEEIIEETTLYMQGGVKVSEGEIAERWVRAGKVKDMDLEKLEAMSEDEKRDFYINEIEKKYGGSVLLPEDIEVDEPTEEVETKFAPETTIEKSGETVLSKVS